MMIQHRNRSMEHPCPYSYPILYSLFSPFYINLNSIFCLQMMSIFSATFSVFLVAHAALVLSKCFVYNGITDLLMGTTETHVCIAGLNENDASRAFVTHSWNGQFSSSGGYVIMASLNFSSTSCSGLRLRRATDGGFVTVMWSIVACRDGEIRNVWRGDLNYAQNYSFDGNYSNLFGKATNVASNSLILGSFALGAGTRFSRDDFGCVGFVPLPSDTSTMKNVGVRFAYKYPDANELEKASAHVQVIDWNTTAASLLKTPDGFAIPFVTTCGIGLDASPEINLVSVASVFNPTDRSIDINPAYRSNVSVISQFLRFPDSVATVIIDSVTLEVGIETKIFRNISDLNIWTIVLGTSNMLGVPATLAESIADVVVAAGVSAGQLFVRRTTSNVALTVYVATVVFNHSVPTPSPTSSPTPIPMTLAPSPTPTTSQRTTTIATRPSSAQQSTSTLTVDDSSSIASYESSTMSLSA
jgi:hypothetical protein